MNYRFTLPLLAALLGLSVSTASSAVLLADNFNEYNNLSLIGNASPIQSNPGGASGIAGNWTRFGAATTGGIDSIAGGVGGTRGASYSAGWASGTAGFTRYTFASIQDLSLMEEVTLDLNVSTSLAGTTVAVQIRSGSTYYQSTTPLALTNTSFSTFTFDTTSAALTRVAGTGSYADTMASVDAIVFVFSNPGGTGSQAIRFDNFNLLTVPEPTAAAGLGLAGLILAGSRWTRRSIRR